MSSILEIDSVMKGFGDRAVLTDIYLKCQTGDIIGMLGRNGCGKSTLLKILFGTVNADSKFIKVDGRVFNHVYKTAGEICYLPQHNFLPQNLTVMKTVGLYLEKKQVVSFLDDLLLERIKYNRISGLSGGELRYLEIKLLINLPYKFILLDEPFNGVAPIMVELLKTMIIAAAKTKGVILTDHDYHNVLDVANKYCLIYDGSIEHIENKHDLVRWNYLTERNLE